MPWSVAALDRRDRRTQLDRLAARVLGELGARVFLGEGERAKRSVDLARVCVDLEGHRAVCLRWSRMNFRFAAAAFSALSNGPASI